MNADIDYTNKDFIPFGMWPSHSIFEKLPETFHVTDTSYIREIKFTSPGFRPSPNKKDLDCMHHKKKLSSVINYGNINY